MSLANQIIKIGSSRGSKRQQYARRYVDMITKSLDLSIEKIATMAFWAARAHHFVDGCERTAQKLDGAACFCLSDDVINAVSRMRETPPETLLKAYQFAKLPYPKTWIECSYKYGGDSDEDSMITSLGWLLEETQEGNIHIEYTSAISKDGTGKNPLIMTGSGQGLGATLTPDGLILEEGAKSLEKRAGNEENSEDKVFSMKSVLSILLLLNSRSNIIVPGETIDDFGKLNRARRKRQQYPLVELSPIEFDLSRVMRKSNKDLNPDEARALLAESLVMGHFKIRKSGIYWWSAHLRNKRPDVSEETAFHQQLKRDRTFEKSRPRGQQYAPDGSEILIKAKSRDYRGNNGNPFTNPK